MEWVIGTGVVRKGEKMVRDLLLSLLYLGCKLDFHLQ